MKPNKEMEIMKINIKHCVHIYKDVTEIQEQINMGKTLMFIEMDSKFFSVTNQK